MKQERITLCKTCHDKHYPQLKQPGGTALYMATGYCKHCGAKTSVKRYLVQDNPNGSK